MPGLAVRDDLIMSSARGSPGVSGIDVNDSLDVFEHCFDTPKTASRQNRDLLAFCRGQGCVYNRVRDSNSSCSHVAAERDYNGNESKNPKTTTGHISCLSNRLILFHQLKEARKSRQIRYPADDGVLYHIRNNRLLNRVRQQNDQCSQAPRAYSVLGDRIALDSREMLTARLQARALDLANLSSARVANHTSSYKKGVKLDLFGRIIVEFATRQSGS